MGSVRNAKAISTTWLVGSASVVQVGTHIARYAQIPLLASPVRVINTISTTGICARLVPPSTKAASPAQPSSFASPAPPTPTTSTPTPMPATFVAWP